MKLALLSVSCIALLGWVQTSSVSKELRTHRLSVVNDSGSEIAFLDDGFDGKSARLGLVVGKGKSTRNVGILVTPERAELTLFGLGQVEGREPKITLSIGEHTSNGAHVSLTNRNGLDIIDLKAMETDNRGLILTRDGSGVPTGHIGNK